MTKKQITKILTEKIQLCLKKKRYTSILIFIHLLSVISYKGYTMPIKTYNKYFSLLFDTELFNEIKDYMIKNKLFTGVKNEK